MSTIRLRVVIYKEDGLWVAHSLEMDLIGVGNAPAAAVAELQGNVEAQLGFAKREGLNPFRAAPPEILALWDEGNLSALGVPASKKGPGRRKGAVVEDTTVLEWNSADISGLGREPQCV